jgi:hypothetical protein
MSRARVLAIGIFDNFPEELSDGKGVNSFE